MSAFFHMFLDNPVLIPLILLVLLVTVVPAFRLAYGVLRRNKLHAVEQRDDARLEPAPLSTTRFLGIQLDVAILVFGLMLLLVVAGWIHKTFFG